MPSTSWRPPGVGLYVDTWRALIGLRALHNEVGHRQTGLGLNYPALQPHDYRRVAVVLRRAGDVAGAAFALSQDQEA